MTVYYVSMNKGTQRANANVTEGTSAPTADVYVAIGANTAIASLSRTEIADALLQLLNYIRSDGQAAGGGAAVLPFGRP